MMFAPYSQLFQKKVILAYYSFKKSIINVFIYFSNSFLSRYYLVILSQLPPPTFSTFKYSKHSDNITKIKIKK